MYKTFLLSKWRGTWQFYFTFCFTEQNISSALYYFTRMVLIYSNPQVFLSIDKKAVLFVNCVMLKCLVSHEHLESLFSRPVLANRNSFEDSNVLYMHCTYMVATGSAMTQNDIDDYNGRIWLTKVFKLTVRHIGTNWLLVATRTTQHLKQAVTTSIFLQLGCVQSYTIKCQANTSTQIPGGSARKSRNRINTVLIR